MAKKCIIDTDIGIDPDDAIALALAFKSPELDVLRITTVYEKVGLKCRIAREIARLCGKDIPINGGIDYQDLPLHRMHEAPTEVLNHVNKERLEGIVDGIGIISREYAEKKNHSNSLGYFAPLAISDEIRKNGVWGNNDKVSLAAIGPLTNLAYLTEKISSSAKKLERIYIMGGISDPGEQDFGKLGYNLRADIKSAKAVINSGLPITIMPGAVTKTVALTEEHRQILAESGDLGKALSEHIGAWKKINPLANGTHLHDPLTIGMLIWPELYKTRPVKIYFDETAMSCWKDEESNIECCFEVNGNEFINRLIARLV